MTAATTIQKWHRYCIKKSETRTEHVEQPVARSEGNAMTTGKIAIPYYGTLSHPISGFERVFFILEQDDQHPGKHHQVSMGIWDANKTPLLPAWLHQNGVKQVVCSAPPDRSLIETMLKAGIRVFGQGSEKARSILKSLCLL